MASKSATERILLLVVICFVLLTTAMAHAEETIYLPHIGQGAAEPAPQTFEVEWVRLWSIWENGGEPAPLTCGTGHTLQVDVFDMHGEGSPAAATVNGRLDGVTVQVVDRLRNGSRASVTTQTGPGAFDHGVALFDLAAGATVQIVADVDGETVSSPVVTISTTIAEIAVADLMDAGYCADEVGCQALIDADACNGYFSWGVVFKRIY